MILVQKITFFDENRHLFLLFSVNTKNFITFDPEWLKRCPFEDRKRETYLLICAHKNIQPCTYLQKKYISSNAIFPPEFGFLGKYFLFGNFVQKNIKFGRYKTHLKPILSARIYPAECRNPRCSPDWWAANDCGRATDSQDQRPRRLQFDIYGSIPRLHHNKNALWIDF